jgi:hypothetical protein
MGTDDLLREATRAFSLQQLLLKPNLLTSEPLLCQLRPASSSGEALNRPGRRGSTLKGGAEGTRRWGERKSVVTVLVDTYILEPTIKINVGMNEITSLCDLVQASQPFLRACLIE